MHQYRGRGAANGARYFNFSRFAHPLHMMVIPQKPGEGRREVALLLVSSTSIGYPQRIKVGSHLASKALWLRQNPANLGGKARELALDGLENEDGRLMFPLPCLFRWLG